MTKEAIKIEADLYKKEVGRRARDAREQAGFSSADSAAKAMGVSATAVYELERGHSWISAEMIYLAAKYYRVTPASLMPDGQEPTPEQALRVLQDYVGRTKQNL